MPRHYVAPMDLRSFSGSAQRPPAYSPSGGSSAGLSLTPSPPAGWTQHVYSLTTSRDVAWVNVKLHSRARSPSHLPSFFEGEPISGTVEFDLQREDAIKAVSVSVRAQPYSCRPEVLGHETKSHPLILGT